MDLIDKIEWGLQQFMETEVPSHIDFTSALWGAASLATIIKTEEKRDI